MALAKANGLFRLSRDMELVYTQSGTCVGKLGLVASEKYKDKETTLFLDATAFGKTAEILNQYAGTKGTQIFLSGKLQTDQWQDQQGNNRSKVTMVIESFDFVSGQNKQNNNRQQNGYQQQQPQSYAQGANGKQIPVYQENVQQQPTQQYQQQQMPPQQQPIEIDVEQDSIPF